MLSLLPSEAGLLKPTFAVVHQQKGKPGLIFEDSHHIHRPPPAWTSSYCSGSPLTSWLLECLYDNVNGPRVLTTVPIRSCHSKFVPAEVSADSAFISAEFRCGYSQAATLSFAISIKNCDGFTSSVSNYKRHGTVRTASVQKIQNCVSLWAKMQTSSTLAWENIQNTWTELHYTNMNITISYTSPVRTLSVQIKDVQQVWPSSPKMCRMVKNSAG